MPLLLLALTQAISAAPPERIDLTVRKSCPVQRSQSDEVVVCANRGEANPYRINQPPPPPEAQLPKAETQLADGVSAGAETENVDVGGFPSNRMMIRLKVKF
jgi:hypothetical protein